jgi:TFIIF-interacting CTD phosphatase-like protein
MPKTNKTIVLDLDSTLLHTCDDMGIWDSLEIYTNPRNAKLRSRVYYFDLIDVTEKIGTGSKTVLWGVLRPHVHAFLRFCHDYFENIIVWSAGQKKYVHAICDFLFQEFDKQPVVIFSYENCEIGSNYIHKTLSKFQNVGNSTSQEVNIPINTMYALDDYDATFSKNKDNGLHIPPYEPEFDYNGIMEDDKTLLNLMYWLTNTEVMNATDVRRLDKSACFDEPKAKFETIGEFLAAVGMNHPRDVPEDLDALLEEDNEIVHLFPNIKDKV